MVTVIRNNQGHMYLGFYDNYKNIPDWVVLDSVFIVEDSGRILKNKLTVGPMYEDNQRTIGKDETES